MTVFAPHSLMGRRRGRRSLHLAILLGITSSLASLARGDEFSRIVGTPLFDVPQSAGTKGTARLALRAIESLPEVVKGERSGLIIAKTDEGNLAKLRVSSALHRPARGDEKRAMVPVLSLDRFETIDRGDRVTRRARGRDVVLFDRFEFDLDSGQVVPPGLGGDIAFSATGPDGPALIATGSNRLYPIDTALTIPGSGAGRPSPGTAVRPSDFDGRYTLIANGQMSGALELKVAEDGAVSGRFRSDRNGVAYPASGRVAADLSRRIEFEIQFPRSKQAFDGLLWTEDKNVFAGTARILEHPYSFIAVREGMPILAEPIDATSTPRMPTALKGSSRVIALAPVGEAYLMDGVAKSAEELTTALELARKVQSPLEVLIRVPPSTPFERVQRAVRTVRGAGIEMIRLGSAESS